MAKSKQEKDAQKVRYNHKDLPPPKNILLYTYRCFIKLVCYVYFGVGAMILAIFIFPWIRLFVHGKEKYQVAARRFVSGTFCHFVHFMQITRAADMKISDIKPFHNLRGKVIIANHPSILDFVYIMSLVPNANCIVRGNLTHTVLRGVIKQCYIVNTLDFNELCVLCKETLDKGNCVIIFPEGTRTPRHGFNPYKKGAARIALYANCDVQPILVGGNDKYGLGKHDPFWSYNHEEEYIYDIKLLDPIKISDYSAISETLAPKHLTDRMQDVITAATSENSKIYKTNKID